MTSGQMLEGKEGKSNIFRLGQSDLVLREKRRAASERRYEVAPIVLNKEKKQWSLSSPDRSQFRSKKKKREEKRRDSLTVYGWGRRRTQYGTAKKKKKKKTQNKKKKKQRKKPEKIPATPIIKTSSNKVKK